MYLSECFQGSSSGTWAPLCCWATTCRANFKKAATTSAGAKGIIVVGGQGNGLNIYVLPLNPLWQVTHYLLFVGHDPSGVPTHVLKRCHVTSVLIRPPGDMTMLHRIQQSSEVINMFKPPMRFPSTHIRVLPFVILISRPRNHMSEVSYTPSLQTQRDKSISAHKCHKRNYTKETIKYIYILPQARSCNHQQRKHVGWRKDSAAYTRKQVPSRLMPTCLC